MKKIVLIIIVVFLHSIVVAQESSIEKDFQTKILIEKESGLSNNKAPENALESKGSNDISEISRDVIETTDIICKELIPLLYLTVKKMEL